MSRNITVVAYDGDQDCKSMVTGNIDEVCEDIADHPSWSLFVDGFAKYLQVKDENGDLHNLELNYYASGEFVGFICHNLHSLDLCEEVLCELLDASGCLIEGTDEYEDFFHYEDDEDDFEEIA